MCTHTHTPNFHSVSMPDSKFGVFGFDVGVRVYIFFGSFLFSIPHSFHRRGFQFGSVLCYFFVRPTNSLWLCIKVNVADGRWIHICYPYSPSPSHWHLYIVAAFTIRSLVNIYDFRLHKTATELHTKRERERKREKLSASERSRTITLHIKMPKFACTRECASIKTAHILSPNRRQSRCNQLFFLHSCSVEALSLQFYKVMQGEWTNEKARSLIHTHTHTHKERDRK